MVIVAEDGVIVIVPNNLVPVIFAPDDRVFVIEPDNLAFWLYYLTL